MTLAYLFARFPAQTQTFCFREVAEMRRQMGSIPIWSLRYPEDLSADCPGDLAHEVNYLPELSELQQQLGSLRRMWGRYPLSVMWQIKRWGKRSGGSRIYEAAWLGRRLLDHGVSHVHTHFAGTSARTAWWMHKLYGISYSFTGHANDMFCSDYRSIWLEKLVHDASFVVTVSDYSRQWLCDLYPVHEQKICRIYNGLSIAPLVPEGRRSMSPLILSVGRTIEKKGFADLIDACAILNDQGIAFRCQIIGGGPLQSVLRDQIKRLSLEDLVELTGSLPFAEVKQSLKEAACFVLPCVAEPDGGMDNLPTVILEAMEVGLPVISTRLAGIPEMVEHGQTGLLVNERQPTELADAIATLLRNPGLSQAMGLAGYELARTRFDVSVTVSQLLTLLQKAVNCSAFEWE